MATWYISDTHFNHENILKFEQDGQKIRPFETREAMNEFIINKWNEVIKPEDKVWHLGDVAFAVKKYNSLAILDGLNGKKFLTLGNHDQYGCVTDYKKYFHKIYGTYEYSMGGKRGILSHVPVHTSQLNERFAFNIHGHLHSNVLDDVRYMNVSVEQNNFGPINKLDVIKQLELRGVL